MKYYAHTKEGADESEWQPLRDHLIATGDLAAELGRNAGVSELVRLAGYLHDIGKYSLAFQARLRGSTKPVDHSTAGAKEIVQLYPDAPPKLLAELISFCIAGHHTGLPDYGSMGDVETDGTLLARREKKPVEDYTAYTSEIERDLLQLHAPRIKINPKNPGFSISFLTRMLFSALVDADWLETERFVQGERRDSGHNASIEALAQEFNRYLRKFQDPQNEINRKRTETMQACLAAGQQRPGFFELTVPTGGGKTLSSMAFALNHALANGLARIIYVIPFTSIIEQNAAVFRRALGRLGEDNVLEHHSNFDWEDMRQPSDDEAIGLAAKLRLAAENWDIPIVVTTNVQFFESLFASKKSRARKLHNIARSVLIFDEVQTLPRDYLRPSMLAVHELVQNYGSSAVFCTATQPSLERFLPEGTQFVPLAPDPQALFNFYRRVRVTYLGTLPDAALLERLNAHRQVLCIVNTRRHAKALFDGLAGEGRFHLSTLMCPKHRKATLGTIYERLRSGKVCRVVSTQVMEAGIDVDFPVGYRAMAGLDSIIQAAGRVNREGRQRSGDVYVFDPETPTIKRTPTFIEQTAAVARGVLRDFGDDPTAINAIEAYFRQLYTLQDERAFDVRGILQYLDKGSRRCDFDFKTAAENYRLIDDNTVAVIIPYDDDAQRLLNELIYTSYPVGTLRKLQMYTVNIYEREFAALQASGVIQTIGGNYHTLAGSAMPDFYHPQTGLVLSETPRGAPIFFD